jgi:hypothetical protein
VLAKWRSGFGAFDEHIGKLLMNGLNHGVGLPLVEISKNTLLPCFKTL